MKKVFKTLFVLLLTLTMSGCASKAISNSDGLNSGETIEREAGRMVTGVFHAAAQKDYESFVKFMDGDNEEFIRELYDQLTEYPEDYIPEWYSRQEVLIGQRDDYYLVNVVFYEPYKYVEYHNPVLDPKCMIYPFRKVDGELKVVTDTKIKDELFDNLVPIFPTSFTEADNAGRNVHWENPRNFMYLRYTATYWGYNYAEVKFAAQNEDGSIDLLIWIANGTDYDIDYKEATVTLVDDQLGTIVSTTVPIDESVPSLRGALVESTIPADQVITQMAPWNNVQSAVDCTYEEK